MIQIFFSHKIEPNRSCNYVFKGSNILPYPNSSKLVTQIEHKFAIVNRALSIIFFFISKPVTQWIIYPRYCGSIILTDFTNILHNNRKKLMTSTSNTKLIIIFILRCKYIHLNAASSIIIFRKKQNHSIISSVNNGFRFNSFTCILKCEHI